MGGVLGTWLSSATFPTIPRIQIPHQKGESLRNPLSSESSLPMRHESQACVSNGHTRSDVGSAPNAWTTLSTAWGSQACLPAHPPHSSLQLRGKPHLVPIKRNTHAFLGRKCPVTLIALLLAGSEGAKEDFKAKSDCERVGSTS